MIVLVLRVVDCIAHHPVAHTHTPQLALLSYLSLSLSLLASGISCPLLISYKVHCLLLLDKSLLHFEHTYSEHVSEKYVAKPKQKQVVVAVVVVRYAAARYN
jgi:hypothetical protein